MDFDDKNQLYFGVWYVGESTKGNCWALVKVCTIKGGNIFCLCEMTVFSL